MKKEMIISVLVGLFFGLIITYGVYRAKTSLTQNPSPDPLLEATPTTPDTTNGLVAIVSPNDESVQSANAVTIAGTAPANSFVIVFINNEEQITNADDSGHFSVGGTLESGSNVITVYAVDEEGNTGSEERTVIVSTASLEGDDNVASDSADQS